MRRPRRRPGGLARLAHHRCAVLGLSLGPVASVVPAGRRTRDTSRSARSHAPRTTRKAMSESSVEEAMRALCDDLFAAHQQLDPDAIRRFYAEQRDGIYFWERALSYDHAAI